MKIQIVALALVLAAITAATKVHAEGQGVVVMGGDTDCGTWVSARKTDTAPALEHFVLGFLNGLALGRGQEFWRADGTETSREAVYLWLDNYCRANPLSKLVTAAFTLFDQRAKARVQETFLLTVGSCPKAGDCMSYSQQFKTEGVFESSADCSARGELLTKGKRRPKDYDALSKLYFCEPWSITPRGAPLSHAGPADPWQHIPHAGR